MAREDSKRKKRGTTSKNTTLKPTKRVKRATSILEEPTIRDNHLEAQRPQFPQPTMQQMGGVTINNDFPAAMTNTMEGFLDNIAAVVTIDSETMQQMVTSLATLTITNTQQLATIAAQQKTIANLTQKQLLAKPNTYPSGAHSSYETGNT